MFKKLDRNLFGLLSISGIHTIIAIYTGTFLVAYMLNLDNGNFFNVAFYYTISYLIMLVSYVLCSFILPKFNKVYLLRIGVCISCFALLLFAILKENLMNYLIPIAIFINVGNAVYWSSLNSLSNELVKGKKISKYNTTNMVTNNIITIIIPIIFGSIIDTNSLFVVSILAFILGLFQIASTFLLEKPNLTHSKLDFKGYFKNCVNDKNHNKAFKLLFTGYVFYGCKDAINTIVTMLIVLTFKTNTSLGLISSLISCLTILILLITNKKYHSKNAYILLLAAGISAFSMIGLAININKVAIIIFNFCYASVLSIVNRSFAIKRSGLIRAINKKEYIIEHQAVTESCLNIGRSIFYSIILFASFSSEIWVYKSLLIIGLTFVCLYGVFGYILEKEYEKILIEREFKKQKVVNKNDEQLHLIPCYSNPNNDTILR